jgi:DNA sulfur modification protein DndB
MMENILNIEQLRGVASRKNKPQEYKSVRNELVENELQSGWVVQKHNKTSTRLTRRKNHEVGFEDRVWMLMYRMGFMYMSGHAGTSIRGNPNDPSPPENDVSLVAIDDEVALAFECESSQDLHKVIEFNSNLAKYRASRDYFNKAVKDHFSSAPKRSTLFVICTNQIALTETDRAQADDAGMPILTEHDLAYYETLVSQIGTAARYQLLADLLAGRTVPGLDLTVPAIKTKMGKFTAYTFSVRPEYLLKIAFVSHRAKGKPSDIDAYQRMLKKSRLNSIRQYISEGGIFPTNIVVNIAQSKWLTFDRGKQESEDKSSIFGWLNIRPAYRVAWIIDGQHRLFAYAGHPDSIKGLISVMAFVDLPASEQARLFVDINAEQRKVKQSLLQELYAELHWDAEEIEVRMQAVLSKTIQALDGDPTSPFFQRIQKADDVRTDLRCISLTTIFKALEQGRFFISAKKKGQILEYGPLWGGDNVATMTRTQAILNSYFEAIRLTAPDLWDKGAGEGGGLAMNNGVTACINALKSIFHHLQTVKKIRFVELDDIETIEIVKPYALSVGKYFANMNPDQISWFRRLQGAAGQAIGTRRVEEGIKQDEQTFDPPGLKEFLEREKTQTTTRAFETIQRIEQILQSTILSELKNEFGTAEADWFFGGVPKLVRKKVDDRINEEGGKKGGREESFDLIDYREIISHNWELLGNLLGRGSGGNKDAKTKWLVEVNELRKPVMHASKGVSIPITEDQLTKLEEIEEWLRLQIAAPRRSA